MVGEIELTAPSLIGNEQTAFNTIQLPISQHKANGIVSEVL